MKPPSRDRANRKPTAPTAGTGAAEQRPRRYRGRDLRIDATPEQLAAVIGAGRPRPRTSGTIRMDVQPSLLSICYTRAGRPLLRGKECYLDLSANCPNDRHRLVLAPRTSGHSSIARETTMRSCAGHDQA